MIKKSKIFLLGIFLSLLIFSGCSYNDVGVNTYSGAITSPLDQGRVAVNDIDFFYRIALGMVNGTSSIFKFGSNSDLGITEEVIWDGGGNYIFLSSAERLNISSTNINDINGTGTGAWRLIVYGLDENYDEIQEIIYLNGTTTVQTQQSFLRTYRAIVLDSGNPTPIANSNLGTINFISSDTGTLQAAILPNNGQTLMAVYTVPNNKVALVTGLSFNVGQGKQTVFKAKSRNGIEESSSFSVKYKLTIFENTVFADLKTPLLIPPKTDIVITGQLGLAPNVASDASFGAMLVDLIVLNETYDISPLLQSYISN